jgi:hypothetical protein
MQSLHFGVQAFSAFWPAGNFFNLADVHKLPPGQSKKDAPRPDRNKCIKEPGVQKWSF